MKKDEIMNDLLTRGVEHILPSAVAFGTLLNERSMTFYLGIDPTGPTLHIGHGVILRKMRDLQRLGHKTILLIGDFTGMIGDPTDKSAARKRLTRDAVLANAERYKEQASRFLSFTGENAAELKYNSTWLAPLTFADVTELAAHFTVQQMLVRDMFARRMEEGKPVYLHEFLYPLMQGYDSVAMDVDMEIGGNDQTFNMLAGRDLMKAMKGKEKYVVAMKLLADPTGKKMGKTEGNMITFDDAPEDMYGKVMSWPDTMIPIGMELCTDIPMEEVRQIERDLKNEKGNPRDAKMRLARALVVLYAGADAATRAEEHFARTIQRREVGGDIPTVSIHSEQADLKTVLVAAGLASSRSEAERLIKGHGVRINDDEVLWVEKGTYTVSVGDTIRKGRHVVRVIEEE